MATQEFTPPPVKKKAKFSKKKFISSLLIVGAVIFFFTGLYKIDPDEVGVIQRLGKYIHTTEPGLHFKIPFGVDLLTKVKVKHVYKEEFGFRTLQPGVNTKYSSKDYSSESLILTGDLNIADAEWIVQYRIKDPAKFLFNIRNIKATIRDLSESVMRMIIGDHSVDETLVLSRKDIAYQCKDLLQKELDSYGAGIEVVTVNLQNVNPPETVKPAFNDVNAAKQEEEKIVNNAWEKYNKIIPESEGKAKQTIEQAEGYAVNRVNRAHGDVQKFIQVWNEYKKAKSVTKKRIYLEAMGEILPKLDKIYIFDEDQKGVLPHMDINKGGK